MSKRRNSSQEDSILQGRETNLSVLLFFPLNIVTNIYFAALPCFLSVTPM